jgi:hypothetical protein
VAGWVHAGVGSHLSRGSVHGFDVRQLHLLAHKQLPDLHHRGNASTHTHPAARAWPQTADGKAREREWGKRLVPFLRAPLTWDGNWKGRHIFKRREQPMILPTSSNIARARGDTCRGLGRYLLDATTQPPAPHTDHKAQATSHNNTQHHKPTTELKPQHTTTPSTTRRRHHTPPLAHHKTPHHHDNPCPHTCSPHPTSTPLFNSRTCRC